MSEEKLKEHMRSGRSVCYVRREVSGSYKLMCPVVSVIHKIINGTEVLCAELSMRGNSVMVVRAEDVCEVGGTV